MRFLYLYPPGKIYQRGEDRAQSNIEDSTAIFEREPTEVAYCASVCKALGHTLQFFDLQGQDGDLGLVISIIRDAQVDVLLLSSVNSTLETDFQLLDFIKKQFPHLKIIVKSSFFYKFTDKIFLEKYCKSADYIVATEIENALGQIIEHIQDPSKEFKILNSFRQDQQQWIIPTFGQSSVNVFFEMLPDRSVLNSARYVRPDLGVAQATITVSRGCPAACTFCLTPEITGKNLRYRKVHHVIQEIEECLEKGIQNFFLRSDNFTFDRKWVQQLCEAILEKGLQQQIAWVANSRAKPLDIETLRWMKQAGCWLVAVGFESGSAQSLKLMKKGCQVSDNLAAARAIHQAGLKLYGFFMIGLPWENWSDFFATAKHIFKIKPDFFELHIAVAYEQTSLFQQSQQYGVEPAKYADHFSIAGTGTAHVPQAQIVRFRKLVIWCYLLSPGHLWGRLRECMSSSTRLKIYAAHFLKLVFKGFRGPRRKQILTNSTK